MRVLVQFALIFSLFSTFTQAEEKRKLPIPRFVAGEALTVVVHGDSTAVVNKGYPINTEGFIDIPYIGNIFVTDKSPDELASYLSEKLAPFLRDTHISVYPAIRVSFIGHFTAPGLHYIDPDKVVWDAFHKVAGPLTEQTLEEIKVMRGDRELAINAWEIFSKGVTLREAGIVSGDYFVLPTPNERDFWYYFRDAVSITSTLVSAIASVVTVYLLINNEANQ